MLFIVLALDHPEALEQRLAHRQEHIDYWNELAGTVKIAGAMLAGDTASSTPKGSAFILEAADLAEAHRLVDADPFTIRGVFGEDRRIEVLRASLGEWRPA